MRNSTAPFLLVTGLLVFCFGQPAHSHEVWKQIDKAGNLTNSHSSLLLDPNEWKVERDIHGSLMVIKHLKGIGYLKITGNTDKINSDRVGVVNAENKHGYIDLHGQVVIEPLYYRSSEFLNGTAAVAKSDDSSWEIIDSSGRCLYRLPKEFNLAYLNYSGIQCDDMISLDTKTDSGFFNLKEKRFLPTSKIALSRWSDGLSRFRSGELYGFLDKHFKVAIPPKYIKAEQFSEGFASVLTGTGWILIDKTGKTVSRAPAQCSRLEALSEGLARVQMKNGRWGYMDKRGQMVIPATFQNAEDFSEGLAVAEEGSGGQARYGFIDKSGNWIIKPRFYKATGFIGGKAKVCERYLFKKKDWDVAQNHFFTRQKSFEAFVREFGLIGLDRKAVHLQLGKPDTINEGGLESYMLDFPLPPCGIAAAHPIFESVELCYHENRVCKFRYRKSNRPNPDEWISLPFEIGELYY